MKADERIRQENIRIIKEAKTLVQHSLDTIAQTKLLLMKSIRKAA